VSRVEYGGFVVLGRREVPTNCALTDGSGRIESSIDPTSIAELGPDERGFEFEVPASFGITGQHVDLRTGASSLVREAGVSPSDIVDRAAARSESLGEAIARERPTDWILIGAVVLGGVAAVVVAVRAARTSTRRRA
jgi:hypothetical protein